MMSNNLQQTFEDVKILLNAMINDRAVPRNIKRIAQRGIDEIDKIESEGESPAVVASNIMYMVDDLSQDPNCPFHTRTTLYRILSLLEKIKD